MILNWFSPLGMPALVRLPSSFPSSLAYWLFEMHWLYQAGLALMAVALGWRGMVTHNTMMRRTGLGVLLLTALWIASAWLVVTPRERLIQANRAIVAAATHDDVPAIMRAIALQAMFGNLNRREIGHLLTQNLRRADFSSNDIRRLSVHLRGRYATVYLNVLSFTRHYDGPMLTYWRLSWHDQKKPANWQITHIRLLQVNHHAVPPGGWIPRAP